MFQNNLTGIRAVLFDVGNTLTAPDWERIHAASRGIFEKSHDATALQKRIAEILFKADTDKAFLKNLADKSVRTNWHFRQLYEELGLNPSELSEMTVALDRLHLEKHLWTRLDPDALDVLKQLKNRGLRLGVISNSEDGRVRDVLDAVEILPFLDVYLDSHVVGFTKPDPKIFLMAVERLGIEPDETVFIGDSFTQDVIGAQSAGLNAILFDPLDLHSNRDVPKIRSLKEIL